MAERYKLKFDNLYTVTDDGYLEVPLDPNKVLLKSTEEEVTGGYYDGAGEWHEFGGSGETSIQPTLTITVVNNLAEGWQVSPTDESLIKIENNHIVIYGGVSDAVEYGESKEFVTTLLYNGSYDEFDYVNIGLTFFVGDGTTFSATNLTNCTIENVDEDDYIVVTDPTKEASCTLTYTLA